jgi:hypothetical protein
MKSILTAVLGLALLAAPGAAFARAGGSHGGGGSHGAGFHGGGGFHAAPAAGFRAAPGYGVAPGFRGTPGLRIGGPPLARAWAPGYWGFRGGARVWIGGASAYPPYPGWAWMAPHWVWNGYAWTWQGGYWAPRG